MLTKEEFDEIMNKDTVFEKTTFNARDFINKQDRTLAYGYDFDSNTVHLYFKDGEIHYVVFDFRDVILRHDVGDIPFDFRYGVKRMYPHAYDREALEFFKRENNVPSTTVYDEETAKRVLDRLLAGETYIGEIAENLKTKKEK